MTTSTVPNAASHSVSLPASPEAPSSARREVRSACTSLPVATRESAVLAVSELVTNAVVHAHPPITLTVEILTDAVKLTVTDGGLGCPRVRRRRSPHANHGRGLQIVDALSAAWGTTLRSDGKSVWCIIDDDVGSRSF
jgi:anti-sigma regulatory factor (Ser/Thr protein kinase)